MEGIKVSLIKTVMEAAFKHFNETALCQTPDDPFNNTTARMNYAYWPRGKRVSRVIYCESDISIRLVNYHHATFSEQPSNTRVYCRHAIEIARNLALAMEIDQSGYEQDEKYQPNHRSDITHYDDKSVWGDFTMEDHVPDIHSDSEFGIGYMLQGRSWWGEDPSWAVHIGEEHCSDIERRPHTRVVFSDSSWAL